MQLPIHAALHADLCTKYVHLNSCHILCCIAGPGVLVGTALTAVLVKYTFPYDWSWVESLLFGAMFSATDPVAVVAVLKEVRPCSGGLIVLACFTLTFSLLTCVL